MGEKNCYFGGMKNLLNSLGTVPKAKATKI